MPVDPAAQLPKQERSRATRQQLLETTIASLAEQGWSGTTVGSVARRAGVSRGAAQHHFPTREDLITASLEYMFERRIAQARANSESVPGGAERPHALARLIVSAYTDDLFKAALHVWTAAASDPLLRERILPFENRFSREVFEMTIASLGADASDEHTRRTVQTTLDLARGLGLANLLSDDSARRDKIVAAWAEQLAGISRILED